MANGIYTPPKSNLAAIGQMYLEGQSKVNTIRQNVTAQRNTELENLGAQLDQIKLTGLQDADKMWNEAGVLLRQRISQAHADNRAGLISKGDATRITNLAIADANMIVNSTEIIGKNYEDLKKRVEDGEISSAALDQFESGYFGIARNMNDLNRLTLLSDGSNGLEFVHTYQYYDKLGNINTATLAAPLNNSVNPNNADILGFDVFDWTSNISKAIGDRAQPASAGSIPMTNGQTQQWVRDHANDPMIIETIESMIDGYTDKDLIGVLYDGLGARAQWSGSYEGEKTDAELDALLLYNGQGRYYDRDGKAIDFRSSGNDHFTIATKTNAAGQPTTEYTLTDEQRELARAYLRKTAATSLDIDYRNIRDLNRSGRAQNDTDASNTPFTGFNFLNNKNSRHLLGVLHASAQHEGMGMDLLSTDGSFADAFNITGNQELMDIYDNQKTFDPNQSLTGQGTKTNSYTKKGWQAFGKYWLGDNEWNTIKDYSQTGNYDINLYQNNANNFTTIFQGSTGSKPTNFNIKTLEGNDFKNIRDLGYAFYKDDNGLEKIAIVVTGTSEFIKQSEKKAGGGTGTGSGVSQSYNEEKTFNTMGYLNASQSKAVYNELVANYTQFADVAEDLFKGNNQTWNGQPSLPPGKQVNDKYAYAIMKILQQFN